MPPYAHIADATPFIEMHALLALERQGGKMPVSTDRGEGGSSNVTWARCAAGSLGTKVVRNRSISSFYLFSFSARICMRHAWPSFGKERQLSNMPDGPIDFDLAGPNLLLVQVR